MEIALGNKYFSFMNDVLVSLFIPAANCLFSFGFMKHDFRFILPRFLAVILTRWLENGRKMGERLLYLKGDR